MCKISYNNTFAYYIEVELGIELNLIWNWSKNNELNINPYKITKQSNKKNWLYCLEHDYHNYDREGNKIGYEISCNKFYNNRRCSYCGNHKTHYKDSLAYNYPNIAKMIAKVWELWNSGLQDINEISNVLNINRNTTRLYLKNGKKCGKCDYTIEKSKQNHKEKIMGKNNYNATSIICITTKRIFYTVTEGAEFYKIKSLGNIVKCCKGDRNYCGKLEDGTKLTWRYIIWNHNKIYKVIR